MPCITILAGSLSSLLFLTLLVLSKFAPLFQSGTRHFRTTFHQNARPRFRTGLALIPICRETPIFLEPLVVDADV